MTIETKYIAALPDVHALRLECKKCGAAYSIPLTRTLHPPHSCKACSAIWFGGDDLNALEREAFIELQRCLKVLLLFAGAGGVRICLEVPAPSQRDARPEQS